MASHQKMTFFTTRQHVPDVLWHFAFMGMRTVLVEDL